MKKIVTILFCLLVGLKVLAQTSPSFDEPLTLWYDKPAAHWVTEALPIGNGDMGAMIFGGVNEERVQFNHKTLWKGTSGATDLGSYLAFGDLYITFKNPQKPSGYVRY